MVIINTHHSMIHNTALSKKNLLSMFREIHAREIAALRKGAHITKLAVKENM